MQIGEPSTEQTVSATASTVVVLTSSALTSPVLALYGPDLALVGSYDLAGTDGEGSGVVVDAVAVIRGLLHVEWARADDPSATGSMDLTWNGAGFDPGNLVTPAPRVVQPTTTSGPSLEQAQDVAGQLLTALVNHDEATVTALTTSNGLSTLDSAPRGYITSFISPVPTTYREWIDNADSSTLQVQACAQGATGPVYWYPQNAGQYVCYVVGTRNGAGYVDFMMVFPTDGTTAAVDSFEGSPE